MVNMLLSSNITTWESLGSIVEKYSVPLRPGAETDFTNSIFGAWFVSPAHHAFEFVTFAPLWISACIFFAWRSFGPHTKAFKMLTTFQPPYPPSPTEIGILVVLTLSFLVTIIHKIASNTVMFLLQPCHVSAGLLIAVMMWPDKRSPIPHLLLNVYLHTAWGAIAALLFPDLRDHEMLGEVTNFFVEHFLILIAPAYLLYSKRYVVMPASLNMALFSFFLYAFYHCPVLQILALRTAYNLNYVLVPPSLTILIELGPWYRITMYTIALISMMITRFILFGLYLMVMPDKRIFSVGKEKNL
ncbi:unnamed protein product [Umbelopsis ramanniana]